jgi:Zinc finger, C2H2 type
MNNINTAQKYNKRLCTTQEAEAENLPSKRARLTSNNNAQFSTNNDLYGSTPVSIQNQHGITTYSCIMINGTYDITDICKPNIKIEAEDAKAVGDIICPPSNEAKDKEKAIDEVVNIINYFYRIPTTNEYQFECLLCNNPFIRQTDVKNHISITHNHKSPLKCYECGFILKDIYNLKKHIAKHSTKNMPFQCDTCGFGLGLESKCGLARHMKYHKSI